VKTANEPVSQIYQTPGLSRKLSINAVQKSVNSAKKLLKNRSHESGWLYVTRQATSNQPVLYMESVQIGDKILEFSIPGYEGFLVLDSIRNILTEIIFYFTGDKLLLFIG